MSSSRHRDRRTVGTGRPRLLLFFIAAAVALSSCDCEERLRKAVSNPGDRREVVPDAGEKTSRPSEDEPNDVSGEANEIILRGELRPVGGEIETSADVDWYRLSVEDGDPWPIELVVDPVGDLDPSIHVEIEQEDAVPLAYNLGGPGEPESIPVLRVPREGVSIAVRSENGTRGRYELRFQKQLAGGRVEAEPNDEASVAISFEAPGEIQGAYDRPDDRDVFRLIGRKPHVFELRVTPIEQQSQIVRIFDEAPFNEPLLTLQVSGREAGTVPNLHVPAESLLYLVTTTTGKPERQKRYRIRLSPYPPVEGMIEVEPNDVRGQDVDREFELRGSLFSADDIDRFVVERPEEDGREIEPAVPDAGGSPSVQVEPSSEEPVREGADAGTSEPEGADRSFEDILAEMDTKPPPEATSSVSLEPLQEGLALGLEFKDSTGTLDVKPGRKGQPIELCGRAIGPGSEIAVRARELSDENTRAQFHYRLALRRYEGGKSFEIEPNDELADADPIRAGKRTGMIPEASDRDVYAFAVVADEGGAAVRPVELVLRGKEADYSIRLVDAEGGLIGEFNRGGSGAGETVSLDLPPGIYYAIVSVDGQASCEPYEITRKMP